MDAGEIAENGDTGNVLAMECEHTRGLRAEVGGAVGWRNMAMDMLVVHVVCSSDFGKEPCHHLDDVCHRHGTDLELPPCQSLTRNLASLGLCQKLFTGEALDVGQAKDSDPAWGTGLGASR